MTKRHVDYVKNYAANLTPVIPHDARLAANSKIDAANRGKVPGRRLADGTWVGGWKDLGDADMAAARSWDEMGAGVGFRFGRPLPDGVGAIDVDLTVKDDSERVLAIAKTTFGFRLAVRRVDHPEHAKLLIMFRLKGEMPRSFDVAVKQSDGERGKVQFLGPGRYGNIHGVHPTRLRPYVWDNDPADVPLALVDRATFDSFWARLGKEFDSVRTTPNYSAHEVEREPERCAPEELTALVALIPNDQAFETYDAFISMGSAIHGASGGQPWGRAQWLDWCDQVDQGDPDKPERFWDTMLKARIGVERLRRWANERCPQEMAKRAFADAPIEPEALEEADEDLRFAQTFLNRYCLVGGAEFYALPPRQPYAAAAFNLMMAKDEKRLRRYFGDKRNTLSHLFARHSENTVDAVVHEPGRPRFIDKGQSRCLNLWTPPPRPHRDKPIDMEVVDFYEELVTFVLGAAKEARLWMLWHAYLMQHPDWAPGWHWIVQTDQGLGKDLILRPIGLAHGDDYIPVGPKVLTSPYNPYAEKHLVAISEMRERNRDDVYTMLKAITSGNPVVSIHRKYRDPYLAPNVAGFVIFSNELHPLKIAHDDRRFHVVSNFGVTRRLPAYYAKAVTAFDRHWPAIGEWLMRTQIDDADLDILQGNAAKSEAKTQMALRAWERMFLDIVGEIESDAPPPGYLPVATTTDLIKWFKAQELPAHDMPNRLDFPDEIHRLGARPLNPAPDNPKRANPTMGSRLWRIARFWTDQTGVRWDIEKVGPTRLAKLYDERVMPAPDLRAVDDEEDVV
jgi:hypothetical protein